MSLDFIPTGVATGTAGSIMGNPVLTTILASGNSVVPVGNYYYYAVGVTTRLQILDNVAAWNNVTAVGVGGFVCADGVNLRFLNGNAGASETVTLIKIG
jgi:hypothetical protein